MARDEVLEVIIRLSKEGRGAKEAAGELKDVDRQSRKASEGLQKLGGAAKLAAVAGFAILSAAAVKFVKDAIAMGRDMEELRSKFDVVFGDEAPRAAEELERVADRLGRTRSSVIGMAASLQDTFVPMGLARDQAAQLAIALSKLSIDVSSFNNVATADVARDFQSALVGNSETVRKYGIVITEATTKETAYRLGIAETGSQLTEQQKLLARVQQLFEGTSDAQGDAARTSGSLANQQARLEGNMEKLQLRLAEGLTPALADFISWLNRGIDQGDSYTRAMRELGISMPIHGLRGLTEEQRAAIDEFVRAERAADAYSQRLQGMADAAGAGAVDLGAIAGALQDNADAAADAEAKTTSFFDSLDRNIKSKVAGAIADLEFLAAGGLELQQEAEGVLSAIEAGEITPEQGKALLGGIFVALQDLEVEMGSISGAEAASNVEETLGKSIEQAVSDAAAIQAQLDQIEREITILVTIKGLNEFQTGGVVPGPIGQPQLAVVHGGEEIIPVGQGSAASASSGQGGQQPAGGSPLIGTINIQREIDEQVLVRKLETALRRR